MVAASIVGTMRSSFFHFAAVFFAFSMNATCSFGVAPLYGIGRDFLTENPHSCAILRAVLWLRVMPNLSCMRPAMSSWSSRYSD